MNASECVTQDLLPLIVYLTIVSIRWKVPTSHLNFWLARIKNTITIAVTTTAATKETINAVDFCEAATLQSSPSQPQDGVSLGGWLPFPGQRIPSQSSGTSGLYSFLNLHNSGDSILFIWEIAPVGNLRHRIIPFFTSKRWQIPTLKSVYYKSSICVYFFEA